MKCGTSSLHYYLGLHPEIQMSQPKELHFFIDASRFEPEPFMGRREDSAALRGPSNWSRGIDWYRTQFNPDARIRGESTVAYTFPWYTGTAERMAAVVPQAKLIFVVRDPIERMISHYLAYTHAGRERRTMTAALGAKNNWYLAASRYASCLSGFLSQFDSSQILLVRQADLLAERGKTLSSVFRFLEVDETFWSAEMHTMRNQFVAKGLAYRLAERVRRGRLTGAFVGRLPGEVKARAERFLSSRRGSAARPELPPSLLRRLQEELDPDIIDLERLTGWDLADWRVDHNGDAAYGVGSVSSR